jgi:hypothetical protein
MGKEADDDEPAAGTEQQRGLGLLHELGQGRVGAGLVGCKGLLAQGFVLALEPALVDAALHAHRLDDLGVAQAVGGVVLRRDGGTVGGAEGAWVSRSVSQARPTWISAPTMDIQPISALMKKIAKM